MIFAAIALTLAAPTADTLSPELKHQIERDLPNIEPTVNLSAIRYIWCHNPASKDSHQGWTGSGALVAKNTVLTALHVASGDHCVDVDTGNPLVMYDSDPDHDMALMTGVLPEIPYLKSSCQPYKYGEQYYAYGITDFMRTEPIFYQNILIGTGRHKDITMSDGGTDKKMAVMEGVTIPGMSGGPYLDMFGYIRGIVNAGRHDNIGIPMKVSFSYELAASKYCKKS